MRIKCQIPTVTPRANSSSVNTTLLPSFWSTHNPVRPGTTIPIETVMICDVHVHAATNGERSSGGLFTSS